MLTQPQSEKDRHLLPFTVLWWSFSSDEYPPSRLVALATKELTAEEEAARRNNTRFNVDGEPVFLTDFPTDRVLIRIDLHKPHVIMGIDLSSTTASHVEVRCADAAVAKLKYQGGRGYSTRERKLVESGEFCDPLRHRARMAAMQFGGAGGAKLSPAAQRGIRTDLVLKAVKQQQPAARAAAATNGDGDDAQQAKPQPCRYVDIDLRGVWEPIQRIGLERLRLVGYEYPYPDGFFAAPSVVENRVQQQDVTSEGITVEYEMLRPMNSVPVMRIIARQDDNDVDDVVPATVGKQQAAKHQQQQQQEAPQRRDRNAIAVDQHPQPPPYDNAAAVAAANPAKLTAAPPRPSPFNYSQNDNNNNKKNGGNKNTATTGKPLDGCRIVISGYQNPQRGQLRDTALGLGATFAPDWGPGCTHLICVVAGTPKFNQVVMSGFGWIVGKDWIEQCAAQGKRLLESQFFVGSGGPGFPSEEDQQHKQQQPQQQQQQQQLAETQIQGTVPFNRDDDEELPATLVMQNARQTKQQQQQVAPQRKLSDSYGQSLQHEMSETQALLVTQQQQQATLDANLSQQKKKPANGGDEGENGNGKPPSNFEMW